MRSPPRIARALMRALLPRHEISESLDGDLTEGFVRRSSESPRGAAWWYRRRVLTLPYLALRREIGRLRARQESNRVETGGWGMGGMTMDLRVAVRSLLRRPAFSGVAIATLALSIGAATLLFSVVDGVLLAPLPYEEPDQLVTVYLTSDEWRGSASELFRNSWDSYSLTLDHVEAFRSAPGPIESVTGYTYRRLEMDTGDESNATVERIMVDRGTFDVLGVQPMMGRLPSDEEVRESAHVAVLKHRTWTTRFGADPQVLGRSFRLGEETFTVIGVMPPGFFFPTESGGDIWTPVAEYALTWPSFYGVARLEPGATLAEATDFFESTARRLGDDDPAKAGLGGRALPHMDSVVGNVRGGIRLLFGTAMVVVLVACVNLANLFLARAAGRREELAVRASLGAGTGSLASVLLMEAVVIGLIGGVAGVALAAGTIDPFVDALGTSLRGLPRQGTIALDAQVLLFSIAATLLTTLAAGLGPALSAVRRTPGQAIGNSRWSGSHSGTRRSQRLLLSLQAALTVVLVSAAALLGRSFVEAIAVDLGMDTERIAVIEAEADIDQRQEYEALWSAQADMRTRIASIPGVQAVGMVGSLPARGGVLLMNVRPEDGLSNEDVPVMSVTASEGYFESMGISILAGRGFEEGDGAEDELAVVSGSLAMQLYGRTDVVGRHVSRGSDDDPRTLEIVGVVGEARQLSAFQEPDATLYHPMRRSPSPWFYVTMAVDGDPETVLDAATAALLSGDASVEVVEATTLPAILRYGMRHIRLRMILMAALAALAGVLAVIGISGVVAHYLSEQTRDVGIRMALGAARRREVGRVVRHALTPTVIGLVAGIVIARASARVMEGFVFGVDLSDPMTYVAVSAMLLGAAALAAWLPARRAAAIDPARVLNGE